MAHQSSTISPLGGNDEERGKEEKRYHLEWEASPGWAQHQFHLPRTGLLQLLCCVAWHKGVSLKARDLWNICRDPWDHEEAPPNCYSHHCFVDYKTNIYSLKKALKVLKVKNIFRLSIIPLHRDINNQLSFHLLLMLIKGTVAMKLKDAYSLEEKL